MTDNHSQVFYEWNVQMYNKSTQDQNNFEYIAQNLKCTQSQENPIFELDSLEKQFNSYFKINTQTDTEILTQQYDITKLQHKIIKRAEEFKKDDYYLKSDRIEWSPQQKQQLIQILSYISSVWSLINNESRTKTKKYIHKVQIVAIMRILNIDQEWQSKLENHVLEVKTGEGKSIIIGISSVILALIGFNVECCCYSQYLSKRDQQSFDSFFKLFSLQDKIQFSTFQQLTEKIFNTPYNLRDLGEIHIQQKFDKILQKNNKVEGKSILIIDEVDFFFDKDFLGKVYPVVAQISNPEIVQLFKYIWERRYADISLFSVQQSQEYKNLINNNKNLSHVKELIDIKIRQMIQDSQNMENHSYTLREIPNSQEKIIGYQQFSDYRFDIVKRYKTSFAYYVEYQLKNIQKNQLSKVLNLNFNLGCFSYSQILQYYCLTIGVSGTVQQLQQYQKDQMHNFNIIKQTILPSVFGKSLLNFNKQDKYIQVIEDKNDFFDEISNQIEKEINNQRCVIVFFENDLWLKSFKDQFKGAYKFEIQTLDERSNDKEQIINRATISKVVTLSTKSFGRGTDFKCFDEIVKKNEGIHVIQTFLSETEAEMIQIQGRSARNGEKGSYSLVIFEKTLEQNFGFKKKLSNQDKYQQLLEIIQLNQKQNGFLLQKTIQESQGLHNLSCNLSDLLFKQYEYKQQRNFQINYILKDISEQSDSKDGFVNQPSSIKNLDFSKAKKDDFGDPIGEEFDFAKDGSCSEKKILIGQFCDTDQVNFTQDIQIKYTKALQKKGYKELKILVDEKLFIEEIKNFDQIQIFSGECFRNQISVKYLEQRFVEEVLDHLKKRRGLMLWCDNDPFFYHANLILNSLPIGYKDQQPIYMNLKGDCRANQTLLLGKYNQRLQFGSHPIVNGLLGIFEGATICYPKIKDNMKYLDQYEDFGDLQIVGTSSELKPCMFVLNATKYRGRVVFDCGFTKVLPLFWDQTRGTERYVQNCYGWLNNIDQV